MVTSDAAATPGAVEAMRRALLGRKVGSLLTVDDLRPELEAGSITGNAIGAVFLRAVLAGWLQPVGFTASRQFSARGRVVRRYRRAAIGPQGIGERAPRLTPDALFPALPTGRSTP